MTIKFNKKGVFFTFIAITLISLFVIFYSNETIVNFDSDIRVVKIRVNLLNNFLKDFENVYLDRALYASSYKTLTALILYINKSRDFITDLDHSFNEVLLNGTIDDAFYGDDTPIDGIIGINIMEGNTLIDKINDSVKVANETFNVQINYSINGVNISQDTPWKVKVRLNISFNLTSETASWYRDNKIVTTLIDIEGFYDPYYINQSKSFNLKEGTEYYIKFNKTNVLFGSWNLTYLINHIKSGTYVHWENSQAPSFLMRFEGKTLPSLCCGIESIVNPDNLTYLDNNRSFVDYLFWTKTMDCGNLVEIDTNGAFSNKLILDKPHAALYNVTNQSTGFCP